MGEIRRIDVEVAEELAGKVDNAVANGSYADTNAVVDAALRLWSRREIEIDGLKVLIEQGLASGEPIDGNFAVDDVRGRGQVRLGSRRNA